MTPNEVISKAQKRVKTSSGDVDWNSLYAEALDMVFSRKPGGYKFARQEINYIHPQNSFNYQFNHSNTEKSLNKIISMYYTLQWTIIGGTPVPTANTCRYLKYYAYMDFLQKYPSHTVTGRPSCWTEISSADGTNGALIGIYNIPTDDIAVWVYGDFKPSYTVDANPIPILPLQFHRGLAHAVGMLAAMELGQTNTKRDLETMYNQTMAELDLYDSKNPAFQPVFEPSDVGTRIGEPSLPPNFPRSTR